MTPLFVVPLSVTTAPEIAPVWLFLSHLLAFIPYFAYGLVILFAGKLFYEKTSSFSFHDELTERDNPAFGICLGGYVLGIAAALTGVFPATGTGVARAAVDMTTGGVMAILLLRASMVINDRLILNRFSINVEMLRDRNLGAGAAVAGSSLGTGLVLAGALTGESLSWLHSVRDIAIYWAAGQALFVAGGWAFCRTAGYDVQKTMEDDNNTAAGLSLGGFLAALGVLLWAVLQNASSDLLLELQLIVAAAVLGLPLLLLATILTQKLLLPRINLPKEIAVDKNSAAGVICATASLATALLLAAALLS